MFRFLARNPGIFPSNIQPPENAQIIQIGIYLDSTISLNLNISTNESISRLKHPA
jgi:hypothetical protein